MSIEDSIRAAVRDEVAKLAAHLERLLGGGAAAPGDQLTTLTKAARACGIDPDTVRRHYLPKLKRYGTGHRTRISVAELRKAMESERSGEEPVNADDVVERIEEKRRSRRRPRGGGDGR